MDFGEKKKKKKLTGKTTLVGLEIEALKTGYSVKLKWWSENQYDCKRSPKPKGDAKEIIRNWSNLYFKTIWETTQEAQKWHGKLIIL